MEAAGAINWRNTFAFLAGLIWSLLLTGVCYIYVFFFLHFDMFGYEEVTRPEARDLEIILSLTALSAATIGIAWWLRRMGKMYGGLGFYIPALPSLVLLLLVFGPRYLIKSSYYQPFDKKIWQAERPVRMSRQLVRGKTLIGKPKKEIEALLGKGEKTNWGEGGRTIIAYTDNSGFTYLHIIYYKNIAEDAYVGCHCD